MNFSEIEQAVLKWANERKIITLNNHRQMYLQVLRTQGLKLVEELGELQMGIWNMKHVDAGLYDIKDAIGDALVVITSIAWALPMKDKTLTQIVDIAQADTAIAPDPELLIQARLGKLIACIIKNKPSGEICDALISVCFYLNRIAELYKLNMTECYEAAYNVIKDRKGKTTVDGNFIKEGD